LHLVGYLYYWQMGFNSVFKGLIILIILVILDHSLVSVLRYQRLYNKLFALLTISTCA